LSRVVISRNMMPFLGWSGMVRIFDLMGMIHGSLIRK
jgi:hypothetical protein